MIDLSEASYDEILATKKAIEEEILNRQKYLMGDLARQIRALIRNSGLDFDAVISHVVRLNKPKGERVIRFAHPKDSTLTWTGRGKKPNWVHAALDSGLTLDQLKVAE